MTRNSAGPGNVIHDTPGPAHLIDARALETADFERIRTAAREAGWLPPVTPEPSTDLKELEAWLRSTLDMEVGIRVLRGRLRRAVRARNIILREANRAGITRAPSEHGAVIVKESFQRRRVVDAAKLQQAYPEVFKRIAEVTIPLHKAEREIGKEAVAEMCTAAETWHGRLSVSYEADTDRDGGES